MREERGLSITTGTMVRVVLIAALFWSLWFLRDLILIVITAIVLASSLEPAIQFFVKRKMPRLLSLVSVYSIGLGTLGVLFYFFIPAFLKDVSGLLNAIPKNYDFIASFFGQDSATHAEVAIEKGASLFEFFAKNISASGLTDIAVQLFGGLISVILIFVLSFYLSAQEHGIESFLRLITPSRHAGYVVSLWYRSHQKIGRWFQGQIILGLLVGALTFLGLTFMGVESAFFLSAIIIFLEIIPIFGPILAALPAIAIAYTSGIAFVPDGGLTAAASIAVLYFIIQQIESHLIYPIVVRKVIGMPPVLVILSLVVGWKLAGLLGILVSVPVTATLMEYLNDLSREKQIDEQIRMRLEENG